MYDDNYGYDDNFDTEYIPGVESELDYKMRIAAIERRHEERRKELQRKQRRKKRRFYTLLVLFILVALATAGIALKAYFATNVYQDEEEFREYAKSQMEGKQILPDADHVQQTYEFGSPISYAMDYQVIDNETIAAFRDERVSEIKSEYEKTKTAEEKKRAEAHKNEKRYKPLTEALLVNSAAYTAENGAVSLAVYSRENEERDKDMVEVSSKIETYLFAAETGQSIRPEQVLTADYRAACSTYLHEYFTKTYSEEELKEDWESYLAVDDNNFNQFILTDSDMVFYFDEDTVLSKEHGVVAAKVPNSVMKEKIRDKLLVRFIDPNKPMVALTYDDGPGGDSETQILDCLEKYGATATFFYAGYMISSHPEQIKRAYNLGCEIGNHTWDHPQMTKLTTKKAKKQITKTNEAIKKACGAYPTVFRPSYGDTNKTVNALAKMPVIMWSIDTLDWKTRSAKKTFNCIKKAHKKKELDGKIILMHSIHEPTAKATKKIVPWLQKNGYQTVTVSELIKYKTGAPPKNGQVYQ